MDGAWPNDGVPPFVGDSQAIQRVMSIVDAVAASRCTVLIEGASGTGKELVARRIHALSPRRAGPFIPVNCAGVAQSLFESQFFGHVRGAFTGAEQSIPGLVRSAQGGTLLLDEVGELSPALQPKLLRVLQQGEVTPVGSAKPVPADVRFIAATNRCLHDDVRMGRFREDLYYRLKAVRVCLPAMREHPEDIPALIEHFLTLYANRDGTRQLKIDRDTLGQLQAYSWPGNVRELAGWVESLYATKLPADELASALLADEDEPEVSDAKRLTTLAEAERQAVHDALRAANNNRSQAARILGIDRATLRRKLTEYAVA